MNIQTSVSEVAVGDVLLTRAGQAVTVHRIERLRPPRLRLWVKTNNTLWSILSQWNFGSFGPDDQVQKVVE